MMIEPFSFLNHLDFKCVEEVNEHGILQIKGLIAKDNVADYKKMACEEVWVNVRIIDEEKAIHPFFHGIMTAFSLKTEGEVNEMTLELKSGSYLMDLVPHIRSFQDAEFTYKHVLDMSLTNREFIMLDGNSCKAGGFLLQYEETDWEFAKRLASYAGTFLVPEYIVSGQKFYFGIDEKKNKVEIKSDIYTTKANIEGITVIVESRELYNVGQFVLFQNSNYMIGKRISYMKGGEMCHEYHLLSSGLRAMKPYNNKNIQGLSLKALITEVKGDAVQIEIEQDENKGNCGNCWFTYATVYSTPDGTGWYCMPEIGDKVRLTFPDEMETSAYVASSIHLEAAQGRINPDEKSWKNRYQKEILLTPDAIRVRNNAGLSVELLDEGGIKVVSNQDISLQSQRNINLCSQNGEVMLYGKKGVSLNQNGASIEVADEIHINGGKIYMN
jgi:hypothetical protein